MTTDDRPSIAEMRTDAHALEVGAPVLLEIAAAALAWLELLNHRALVAALSKVRP